MNCMQGLTGSPLNPPDYTQLHTVTHTQTIDHFRSCTKTKDTILHASKAPGPNGKPTQHHWGIHGWKAASQPTNQSDKQADRAACREMDRWIKGWKVRSADIYMSAETDRWDQTQINIHTQMSGKTDFTNKDLISFLPHMEMTSLKVRWWKHTGSVKCACWHE